MRWLELFSHFMAKCFYYGNHITCGGVKMQFSQVKKYFSRGYFVAEGPYFQSMRVYCVSALRKMGILLLDSCQGIKGLYVGWSLMPSHHTFLLLGLMMVRSASGIWHHLRNLLISHLLEYVCYFASSPKSMSFKTCWVRSCEPVKGKYMPFLSLDVKSTNF